MELFRDLAEIPADFGPSALTVGNFDGVHLGHQAVLRRIVRDATVRGQKAVAVTFDPHPAMVHRPEHAPALITGLAEKIRRLEATGLDAVLVQHYTLDLARNSPEEYVRKVFVEALHAATVVVGRDVRFGWQNSGDITTMRRLGEKYGFEVEMIDDIGADDEKRWSSTRVRELLADGDVEDAAVLLGRSHVVSGTVVHGEARGRDLGFPTANLGPDAVGLIPADGVYAGWLIAGHGAPGQETLEPHRHPAAISVGTNPTFDDEGRRVEAHVIDREDSDIADFDLYGVHVDVEFVARLRGMITYRGMEPLIEQMKLDVEQARARLSRASEEA